MEELLIFNQNHWLTPLEKSQFFYFLKLVFLISLKEVFLFKISWNTFFWPILPKIKRMEQLPFFWPRPWTIPFQKITIFRLLLTCCFFSVERRFFRSRISWNTLCCPFLPEIKRRKNCQFFIKTMDECLWKNALFSTFLLLVFHCLGRRFFVSKTY